MSSVVSSADTSIFQQLLAAKEAFRQSNRHLCWTDEELELAWTRLVSSSTKAGAGAGAGRSAHEVGFACQTPRTLPMLSTLDDWQFAQATDTAQDNDMAHSMNRQEGFSTQSAPATMATYQMTRCPSARANTKRSYSTFTHGSQENAISRWQHDSDAPFTYYSLSSSPGHVHKRPRPPMADIVEATEFSLPDWVRTYSDNPLTIPATCNPSPAPAYRHPTHLSVPSAASIFPDQLLSESPVPGDMAPDLTDVSTLSTQMSRNISTVSNHSAFSLPRALNDMHLNPQADFNCFIDFDFKQSDPLAQEHMAAFPHSPYSLPPSKSYVSDGGAVQSCSLSLVSPATDSSESTLSPPPAAQPMKREHSNKSTSSSTSSNTSFARQQQKHAPRESVPIAPKMAVGQQIMGPPQMKRITSETGEVKEVAAIPRKEPYQRPQREKLLCDLCHDRPEGFRGEHELQRHKNRAHALTRKVWICVDVKEQDPSFLANCKACKERKRYGAYYNAAAHLRRTHFNPRKRGRKAKSDDEKRGGKGGGDWPAISVLKDCWLREIEEAVDDSSPPVDFGTENGPSDANIEADDSDHSQSADAGDFDLSVTQTLDDPAMLWSADEPLTSTPPLVDAPSSFQFNSANANAERSIQHDVTFPSAPFDEQHFSMFDDDVAAAELGVFTIEDSCPQPQTLPVYQEPFISATWLQ